jgi:hypothetical protein
MPEEFVLADLHEARSALEEITGRAHADDVLRTSSSASASESKGIMMRASTSS